MKTIARLALLLPVLALGGCSAFQTQDSYEIVKKQAQYFKPQTTITTITNSSSTSHTFATGKPRHYEQKLTKKLKKLVKEILP